MAFLPASSCRLSLHSYKVAPARSLLVTFREFLINFSTKFCWRAYLGLSLPHTKQNFPSGIKNCDNVATTSLCIVGIRKEKTKIELPNYLENL